MTVTLNNVLTAVLNGRCSLFIKSNQVKSLLFKQPRVMNHKAAVGFAVSTEYETFCPETVNQSEAKLHQTMKLLKGKMEETSVKTTKEGSLPHSRQTDTS